MTLFCLVGHYFACYFLKPPLTYPKYCVHSINNVLRFVACKTGIIINADVSCLSLLQNFIDCLYLFFNGFSLCNLFCCFFGHMSWCRLLSALVSVVLWSGSDRRECY